MALITTFEEWQKQNRRLLLEGWSSTTLYMLDGSVEHWAEKDGLSLRNDPPEPSPANPVMPSPPLQPDKEN